jgi:hypothetical protein
MKKKGASPSPDQPSRPKLREITVTVHSTDASASSKSDGAALEALTRRVLNPARQKPASERIECTVTVITHAGK